MHGGLGSRVAASDDEYVVPGTAERRFAGACAVIDTCPTQLFFIGQVQSPILHSGGTKRGTSDDFGSIGQVTNSFARQELASDTLAQHEDLRAKVSSLFARSFRQIGAADASRKAEVILDLGAGACLSAHRKALDHDRLQTLRRPINSGAEPCRSGLVDGEVVFRAGRTLKQSELFADLPKGRALHSRAIGKNANRQPLIMQSSDVAQGACLFIPGQLDPIEKHIAAMEKFAYSIRLSAAPFPEKLHSGFGFVRLMFPSGSSTGIAVPLIVRIPTQTQCRSRPGRSRYTRQVCGW